MTQFLHNLYFLVTMHISGRHRFVIKLKGGPKNEIILDFNHSRSHFLLLDSINPSIAQTPEQLYQKGLMKEEGEGALQDAINLYSQVADNLNADQSLQAKALLHIGMCYEKLGTKEATKAYQRLVNTFPNQTEMVGLGKSKAGGTWRSRWPGDSSHAGFSQTPPASVGS